MRGWPESGRPRERLFDHSPQARSQDELLAIFLRTGLPGRGVLGRARGALERFGPPNRLLNTRADDSQAMEGFGPAKGHRLLAVIELARRAFKEELRRGRLVDAPPKVRPHPALTIDRLRHEVFMALLLNAQNRLIEDVEPVRGRLTQTSVNPREVVKDSQQQNAAAVILAHNHPSGLAEPRRRTAVACAARGTFAGRHPRARPRVRGRRSSISFGELGPL